MSPRDDLIADWRKRLAEAIEAPAEPSSRPAWLTRLRVRLYRFLLSLYGDREWNIADSSARDDKPRPAANEFSEPTTWQGKPAKDISAIRAALSSVADARSQPNVPGSYSEGQGQDTWIVVATFRGGVDPYRCASLLQACQIPARWVNRQSDVTVEVRAKDTDHAARIIYAKINSLRVFSRSLVPTTPLVGVRLATTVNRFSQWLNNWSCELTSLFLVALVYPLAYFWAAIGSSHSFRDDDIVLSGSYFDEIFWLAFRGLLTLAILTIWLRAHWRARRKQINSPTAPSPRSPRSKAPDGNHLAGNPRPS